MLCFNFEGLGFTIPRGGLCARGSNGWQLDTTCFVVFLWFLDPIILHVLLWDKRPYQHQKRKKTSHYVLSKFDYTPPPPPESISISLLQLKNAWKTIFWYFGVTFQGQTSLLAVFRDSGGFQAVENPNIQEHHNITTEIQNATFFCRRKRGVVQNDTEIPC